MRGRTRIPMSGKKYGRLTVIAELPNEATSFHTMCRCACDCGMIIEVRTNSLRTGNSKSCGCLQRELISEKSMTHGRSKSGEYQSWCALRSRCNNRNNQKFNDYGGRGVKVCPEWSKSFAAFVRDMGPRPGNGYTIERQDNDGDYCPSNCRWATRAEQLQNTRRNHNITFNGATKCLAEWSKFFGIHYQTLQSRIRKGWSLQNAFAIERKLRA